MYSIFGKAIGIMQKNDIKPIVFIPPANYMYAISLFGEKFTEIYNKNVIYLKEIVGSHGISLLDLSYALKDSQFADIHTIDETANYEGRKIVVEKLIEELNRSR